MRIELHQLAWKFLINAIATKAIRVPRDEDALQLIDENLSVNLKHIEEYLEAKREGLNLLVKGKSFEVAKGDKLKSFCENKGAQMYERIKKMEEDVSSSTDKPEKKKIVMVAVLFSDKVLL